MGGGRGKRGRMGMGGGQGGGAEGENLGNRRSPHPFFAPSIHRVITDIPTHDRQDRRQLYTVSSTGTVLITILYCTVRMCVHDNKSLSH